MRRSRSLLLAALLSACGTTNGPLKDAARGGKRYGGIFNSNETEELRGIFPLELTQASAHRVMAQVYQGLVKLDQRDLHVVPCLAERWEVDPSATTYTFHLRRGVRFHDDPVFPDGKGRELTARDVVHCFTAICTESGINHQFWLFQDRLLGANEHYAATSGGRTSERGVEGIEAIDEHTVRIRLAHPEPNFLHIIAHQGCWIWPEELPARYGDDLAHHAIGTGPFRVKAIRPGEALVLERNPDHWEVDAEGNRLPFLDGVRVTFVDDKARELEQFIAGHISAMYELPVDSLGVLADSVDAHGTRRFIAGSLPGLTTQFYAFNSTRPPFNDVRVRQAFALAIDRNALVDHVLKGLAVPATHGLVAPGMAGYPYDLVDGFAFDPDSARRLLARAGYPEGRGFPPQLLQVNGDGFAYIEVAEAVQQMLERELHVNVAVSVLPAVQHFDRVELGRANFWREGWIVDYPDPENFLSLLYGRNAVIDTTQRGNLNSTRYHDPEFDALFSLARETTDPRQRLELLAKAERRAMRDAVLTPLYHERNVRLLQPWVRDFPQNAMEYRDLGPVWFEREDPPSGPVHGHAPRIGGR